MKMNTTLFIYNDRLNSTKNEENISVTIKNEPSDYAYVDNKFQVFAGEVVVKTEPRLPDRSCHVISSEQVIREHLYANMKIYSKESTQRNETRYDENNSHTDQVCADMNQHCDRQVFTSGNFERNSELTIERKGFNEERKISTHFLPHKEGKCTCDVCQKAFPQKISLLTYTSTDVEKQKPFECVLCKKSYSRKSYLTDHMRSHLRKKTFVCYFCKIKFARKQHLVNHIRRHTGERPFSCNVCNTTFSRKDMLTVHMRIHTGEKRFTCDICKKSFVEKGTLLEHLRIHTGEAPFSCNVCCKTFKQRSQLLKHARTHIGEKGFPCSVCEKSYTEKKGLQEHMNCHTGETPYICEVCKASFTTRYLWTKHVRIHK